MVKKIVIIGSGFAGLWSAISARRLIDLNKESSSEGIEVLVIAPEPKLVLRPRLYEENAAQMSTPLVELFKATGVRFTPGIVDTIRTTEKEVEVVDMVGTRSTLPYDKLILAAGSRLIRPNISGLREHAFSIDNIQEAAEFEAHLRYLARLPSSQARNTVVVCGGGFTGIELATELPRRLRSIFGLHVKVKVVIVDQADVVGVTLGDNIRPVLLKALEEIGVEVKLGAAIKSVDAEGVVTTAGERIESLSIVWTVGMEATPLTKQIPGEKDTIGRLVVDDHLRVPSCSDVFATGDAASAMTDDKGHCTLMSCQHAIPLGRVSGHNAAADLLKVEGHRYEQPSYSTLLDLGAWGSVLAHDWDRQVLKSGAIMKETKEFINRSLIYPPTDPIEAIAAADPALPRPTAMDLFA
jgi:NADH dehydrogenase